MLTPARHLRATANGQVYRPVKGTKGDSTKRLQSAAYTTTNVGIMTAGADEFTYPRPPLTCEFPALTTCPGLLPSLTRHPLSMNPVQSGLFWSHMIILENC